MPGEGLEHRRRLRRAVTFAKDGRGRKLGIGRRRDQIDPDADDQKGQVPVRRRSPIRAGCRRSCGRRPARRSAILAQAHGALEPVRPTRRRPPALRQSQAAPRDRAGKPAAGPARHRGCRAATTQARAASPTPGGLLQRPHQSALLGAGAREPLWPRHWCCRRSRAKPADSHPVAVAATSVTGETARTLPPRRCRRSAPAAKRRTTSPARSPPAHP